MSYEIYVVEDDVNISEIETFALKNVGYETKCFDTARSFYEALETKIPDMEVEIWQYSDKGVVEGIEPLVDLNAWVPSLE